MCFQNYKYNMKIKEVLSSVLYCGIIIKNKGSEMKGCVTNLAVLLYESTEKIRLFSACVCKRLWFFPLL